MAIPITHICDACYRVSLCSLVFLLIYFPSDCHFFCTIRGKDIDGDMETFCGKAVAKTNVPYVVRGGTHDRVFISSECQSFGAVNIGDKCESRFEKNCCHSMRKMVRIE